MPSRARADGRAGSVGERERCGFMQQMSGVGIVGGDEIGIGSIRWLLVFGGKVML
jgi:hypothetical protein